MKSCTTCRETDPKKFYKTPGKPKNKCMEYSRRDYRQVTRMKRQDLEFRKKQASQMVYGTE